MSAKGNKNPVVDAHEEVVRKKFGLKQPETPLLQNEIDGKLRFHGDPRISNPRANIAALWNKFFETSPSKDYDDLRLKLVNNEKTLAFDYDCERNASETERKANNIVQEIVQRDKELIYKKASKRLGFGGQEHERFYGDHFLSNRELIERTELFNLLLKMPKGGHLHIHFNANLREDFLLNIAQEMAQMYIWSSMPLVRKEDFDKCRIQFSILSDEDRDKRNRPALAKGKSVNPFDTNYSCEPKQEGARLFKDFINDFPSHIMNMDAMQWLRSKLVFHEDEAHHPCQSIAGAWEKFNGRTQMLKGLFNYETAFRKYTRACLEEFVADNIQYAEIRPNFMESNQVLKDNGSSKYNNEETLELIIEEYEKFQREHKYRILKGLKVIWCFPRSMPNDKVAGSLQECLQAKLNKRLGPYIAGFDLVGEEGQGKPLRAFRTELLTFKRLCAAQGVDIPFLFHCGETLEMGTETDGNVFDALLLGSKRIGHGFALPRHPYVMELMKQNNVCVEVCPISNEILGLTPRISGHAVYNLLANNVPCTISTDNGTPFRSRLSHDFYQIMAGKSDMTLHGLRQLIVWSIEHSCLEKERKQEVLDEWRQMWEKFCADIIREDKERKQKQSQL